MTYTNAEKMILSAADTGSADASRKICALLDYPEKRLRVIKVFGESGKSSTVNLLSAAISAAGYKVGRLTTPCIGSARESICVDERPLSIEQFSSSAEKVKNALKQIKKDTPELEASRYDLLLATALCAFDELGCDFAVIETDTALYSCIDDPLISIITTVNDTKSALGICARLDRRTGEVITAMQSREVYKIIFDKCAEINRRLSMPLRNSFIFMSASLKRIEFTYNTRLYSVGTGAYYQIYNLLTVIEATEALTRLGFKIPSVEVCSAVLGRGIPLRFEMLSVMPTVIIDRADSESKRRRLIETIKMQNAFVGAKPTVICEGEKRKIAEEFLMHGLDAEVTLLPEKDAKKALKELCPKLDEHSVTIILGSSAYCENLSKIIKDILM